MVTENKYQITEEDRRDFLKALGVSGAVAATGITFEELRQATTDEASTELAPIGQSIQADMSGALNTELIASQQAAIAEQAKVRSTLTAEELTGTEPPEELQSVQAAAQPLYNHLSEVEFFESTTEHLPRFKPAYLETAVQAFVNSAALTAPFGELGMSDQEGVDLLTTVVTNAEELSTYHWAATDQIRREQIEIGEYIPPMTQGAAGGTLLWLKNLESFLWKHQALLSDEIVEAADWYGQAMTTGFYLMSEGAKIIGEASGELADEELGALLSTGFAVQAIAQGLLPQDVTWITEEMRGERRTDLKAVRK